MHIDITDQTFDEEVIKSDKIVMVDFWAVWCGPCQMMGPIIEDIGKEFEGKIKVGKVNVDENPQAARKYDILSIPTIKFYKNGQVIDELIGLRPKELLAKKISSLLLKGEQ